MATHTDVIRCARNMTGWPFRHQGRDFWGIDCAGLVITTANLLGISDFDVTGYTRTAQGFNFVKRFQDNMDEVIPIVNRRPGDAAIFALRHYPCHSTILSTKYGQEHIIHAYEPAGKVVEEPLTHEWISQLRYVFRYRGLED